MKANHQMFFILVLAVLVLPAGALSASGHKDTQNADRPPGVGAHVAVDMFVGKDRDVIRRYCAGHPGNLPPGLAKRGGDPPPGLEEQLRHRGQLPPGREKKVTPFPVEVERRLPPLKPGLMRGVIEGRAVIVNRTTSAVLDVLVVL